MSNRPTGVTILAVLAIIGGLISLALGGFMTFMGPMIGNEMAKQSTDASGTVFGGVMAFVGIVLLVQGLLQLVASYGLFTLKGWAWLLAVLLQILSLVVNGFQIAQGQRGGAIGAAIIAAAILYYLFRPHVKKAFGRV